LIRFACPACGRKFATKPELAGLKIRCSGCGAGVRVPQGEAPAAAQPSRPALKTFGADSAAPTPARPARAPAAQAGRPPTADTTGDSSSLLDDLATIHGENGSRRAEALLPSRTEVMPQVRPSGGGPEAAEAPEKAQKPKKKKKKQSGYFDPKETLTLVGGILALVAVLAGLAWAYPNLRFPLGGFLCVVGFIVYLLGLASLRQLVAEEGAFQILLFRFFPPYQLWYVATHWVETKDYVAFLGSGLVILALGGGVIKMSPINKRAEASERAHQKAQRGGGAEIPPAVPARTADEGG
jgi:hypothetical protein